MLKMKLKNQKQAEMMWYKIEKMHHFSA